MRLLPLRTPSMYGKLIRAIQNVTTKMNVEKSIRYMYITFEADKLNVLRGNDIDLSLYKDIIEDIELEQEIPKDDIAYNLLGNIYSLIIPMIEAAMAEYLKLLKDKGILLEKVSLVDINIKNLIVEVG